MISRRIFSFFTGFLFDVRVVRAGVVLPGGCGQHKTSK
jgi:hypothetical protein